MRRVADALARFVAALMVMTLLALGQPNAAQANGLENQIPSCYVANQLPAPTLPYDKLLVVMVDQTVQLDANLQAQMLQSIAALVQPGTRFAVGEFSAYSQGRYLDILTSGIAETAMTQNQLNNIPLTAVDPFNKCLADQLNFARGTAEKAAYAAMQGATSSLDQSEILMAMKTIAAPIKSVDVPHKILLVATDGLEYSTVADFYGHGTARDIDPDAEMGHLAAAGMTGDFGGAQVYVIGGAMAPPAKNGSRAQRDGYRNAEMLTHLAAFWADYFKASDATLVAFGEPALVSQPAW
jgi:hypothetical protein